MQMKSGVVYVTTKRFDAYYCGCGRVTVNPGATFCLKGNRVYFINSKNYLPYEATNDFKNSFFNDEAYKKEVLYENTMVVSSGSIQKFNQNSSLSITSTKNNIKLEISTPWEQNVSVFLTDEQIEQLSKNLQDAIISKNQKEDGNVKEEEDDLFKER